MFKHASNDCTTLKLALCLAIILPATRAFTFKPSDNLLFVNSNEKLEKFTLKVENFYVDTFKGPNDTIFYRTFLTAKKRTMLVIKNPNNNDPVKLENNDGVLIIGPGTQHPVMYSDSLDAPVEYSDPFDLWTKLESKGKLLYTEPFKNFVLYEFEEYPPLLVEEVTGSNSFVFDLLNEKYFNSQPETYFETVNINPLEAEELVTKFKSHVLTTMESNLDAYLQATIFPKRDKVKKGYFCLNFINKCAHTENAELLKVIMNMITTNVGKVVNGNVSVVFDSYYQDTIIPLFDESGIKDFIFKMIKPRKLNLIVHMVNEHFNQGFEQYKSYTLAFGSDEQNWSTVHTGHMLLEGILDEYLYFIRVKAQDGYDDLKNNSSQAKAFIESFGKALKTSVELVNKELDDEYKVSFDVNDEKNEKEELYEELLKSADFIDFILSHIKEQVRFTFSQFLFNYISVTANYTMLNELMLRATDFNPNYQNHQQTLLDKFNSKAAATLNNTNWGTYRPMSTALVLGEPAKVDE